MRTASPAVIPRRSIVIDKPEYKSITVDGYGINVYEQKYTDNVPELQKLDFADKKVYKIVLIRHAESVFTKEKKFCGWSDSKLTTSGQK